MRVLVTWGSKRGGTEGIARIVAGQLQREGVDVDVLPAAKASVSASHDAVIVGGALYANRWHDEARSFVQRNRDALRRVPTWLFSSGPLDDSAAGGDIPPTREVESLMDSIGAREHRTFGGRLARDATGFPASAMAKQHAGDWRDPVRICGWASQLARELPSARPGVVVEHPARSPWSVLAHATIAWATCAALVGGLFMVASQTAALVVHAIAAPMVFAAVGLRYFGRRGARAPLPTALAFAGVAALLDLAVGGLLERSVHVFASVLGIWLPFALIFVATWITGVVVAMVPRRPTQPAVRAAVG